MKHAGIIENLVVPKKSRFLRGKKGVKSTFYILLFYRTWSASGRWWRTVHMCPRMTRSTSEPFRIPSALSSGISLQVGGPDPDSFYPHRKRNIRILLSIALGCPLRLYLRWYGGYLTTAIHTWPWVGACIITCMLSPYVIKKIQSSGGILVQALLARKRLGKTVLRIRIRRIWMFLGLLDPDPDPSLIKQK